MVKEFMLGVWNSMLAPLASAFVESYPYLVEGIWVTIKASLIALVAGMAIGLVACLLKMSKSKVLSGIASFYIWVIRGTPMIVQAMFVYFGVNQVLVATFGRVAKLMPFSAGVITLSLNAGAYLAEIFRGGIQSVPKGQTEAARSLGLSKAKTMVKVVLPQAIKIAIPSIVNQFIITIKDTSILTVIGLKEIVNKAGQYVAIKYNYFTTYIWVAVYYLAIISLLMIISRRLERKLNYDRKG